MSRDEIIRMAREADLIDFRDADDDPHTEQMVEFLERFAALVAAREREACAQVAMEFRRGAGDPVCGEVATAIRTRRDRRDPIPDFDDRPEARI